MVQVANLLPWSIRDGERYVEVSAHALRERELPSCEAIRNFPTSAVERVLLKDLSSNAVRRNQTELVKGLLEVVPSASQRRIFKAVRDRFLRCFPRGRIEIGERTWNLAGDALKVYRVYAAVREALDAIAEPQLRLGRNHAVTLTLPVGWVEMVWDPGQPAIRFVPDLVLDGLRQALSGFDPRRIKRCPECGAFFLAQRLDKSACSQRCLNLARVHRYRAKQPQYEFTGKLKSAGLAKPGPVGNS